jgi:hypothetical protein
MNVLHSVVIMNELLTYVRPGNPLTAKPNRSLMLQIISYGQMNYLFCCTKNSLLKLLHEKQIYFNETIVSTSYKLTPASIEQHKQYEQMTDFQTLLLF